MRHFQKPYPLDMVYWEKDDSDAQMKLGSDGGLYNEIDGGIILQKVDNKTMM